MDTPGGGDTSIVSQWFLDHGLELFLAIGAIVVSCVTTIYFWIKAAMVSVGETIVPIATEVKLISNAMPRHDDGVYQRLISEVEVQKELALIMPRLLEKLGGLAEQNSKVEAMFRVHEANMTRRLQRMHIRIDSILQNQAGRAVRRLEPAPGTDDELSDLSDI